MQNKSSHISFLTASFVALLSSAIACQAFEHSCAKPDASQLIHRDVAGAMPVTFYPVANSRGTLRWAFASWGGPPDGMAFIVGCDGKSITSVGTGLLDKIRAGPIVNHLDTVEIIVVPDSGTGISDQSVELLQFNGRKIEVLWNHISDDKWVEPFDEGEEAYLWHYSDDGSNIVVRGKVIKTERPTVGGPSGTHTTTKREVFCLRDRTFSRC